MKILNLILLSYAITFNCKTTFGSTLGHLDMKHVSEDRTTQPSEESSAITNISCDLDPSTSHAILKISGKRYTFTPEQLTHSSNIVIPKNKKIVCEYTIKSIDNDKNIGFDYNILRDQKIENGKNYHLHVHIKKNQRLYSIIYTFEKEN